DALGGAVVAIEEGFIQDAIGENAYRRELARSSGDEVVVGVNRYQSDEPVNVPIQKIDAAVVDEQVRRVQAYKATQDMDAIAPFLQRVREVAAGTDNLLPVMKDALLAGATMGQVANALRDVFDEHGHRAG
ncbi:MAG: methylmalonyl-CoA mutase family protein, partial [Thermomicrobiales bacterium]